MIGRLIRLRKDEAGVTAVEFGLLLFPMSVLLFGFLELAYMSYLRAQLQGTVNEVARIVSVENPRLSGEGTLEQRVEARIQERMSAIVHGGDYRIRLTNYQQFTGIGQPEKLTYDKNNNGRYDAADEDCWLDSNPNGRFDLDSGATGIGGADDVVLHQVSLTVPHLFPIVGFVGGPDRFTIEASTAVRSQPYAGQRQPEERC